MTPLISRRTFLGTTLTAASASFSWAKGSRAHDYVDLCREKGATAQSAGEKAIKGADSEWLFPTAELIHAGEGAWWENQPSVLAAIVAWRAALEALGVELILVPVPTKVSLFPEKFDSRLSRDSALSTAPFFAQLAEKGVSAIDLETLFRENAESPVCTQDSHWSPVGAAAAARAVWNQFKNHSWMKEIKRSLPAPSSEESTLSITGDLAAMVSSPPPSEKLSVVKPYTEPVPANDKSPVLIVGDSHTLVFSEKALSVTHHCTGAGFRDHLQALTGIPCSLLANASSGADAARALVTRRAASNPAYWEGRKAVVWCFSAREFTQSRWRVIPPKP